MNPHEEGSSGEEIRFSTQVRYNKDLFTNAATPVFCIFIGIGIYFTLSTALDFSVGKRNQISGTWYKWGKCTEISNLTTYLLLDQKKVDTSVFYNQQLFIHMVLTPGVFYIFSSGARKHVLHILGCKKNEAQITIELNWLRFLLKITIKHTIKRLSVSIREVLLELYMYLLHKAFLYYLVIF